MSRIGDCVNCRRETSLVAKGLCGVCYNAVHGKFEEGAPEYDAALKKARERCQGLETDPKAKKGRTVVKAPKVDKSLVEALKVKRHVLMDQITKINQAIEVIEAL